MTKLINCFLKFGSATSMVLIILFITSCSEGLTDTEGPESNRQVELEYRKIISTLGVVGSDLKITDNAVIIDDIFFERSYLDDRIKLLSNGEKALAVSSRVSRTNIRNIDVFIENGFTAQQETLILQAMQNWNSINRSAINMTEVNTNNNADLTIAPDFSTLLPTEMRFLQQLGTECNGVLGIAWFSNNQKVGRWISINQDFAMNGGNNQFRLVVEHEIGHTLGFSHGNDGEFTNETVDDATGQSGQFTVRVVPCTLAFEEGTNLMEGGAACDLHDLSADELLAAEYLYPSDAIIQEVEEDLYESGCPNGEADLEIPANLCSFDGGSIVTESHPCYDVSVTFCCMPN